jgi:hypothetical protein
LRNNKQIRRLMREYAATAHELELRRALEPLADAFRAWERGELDSFEIETLIHRFHQGAAREIYAWYATGPEPAVARAIATGLLARESIPAEII